MAAKKNSPHEVRRDRNPLISSSSMLILAGFLVGMASAMAVDSVVKQIVFLAGAFGLVAFLGLKYAAHLRRKHADRRDAETTASKMEQRLNQHLGNSPAANSPRS